MISHKHKCIFIHIPRTGGTSIEKALTEADWWKVEKKTKHLDWKTAKNLYKDNWEGYFKFTVVRNPWDWMVSLFRSHRGRRRKQKTWKQYLSNPTLVAHEQNAAVQSEIIGDEMDFVLKFENLQNDFNTLLDKLGVKNITLPHSNQRIGYHQYYTSYYNDETKQIVAKMHAKDIKKFSYTFDERKKKKRGFEMFDQVYCINLARNVERKEHMIKEFKRVGTERYQFIKAVDGDSQEAKAAVKNPKLSYSKKTLGPFKIANWLSHIKTWETIAKQPNSFCLICEDDIKFTKKCLAVTNDLLSNAAFIEHGIDMNVPILIRLGWSQHFKKDARYSGTPKFDTQSHKMSNPCYAINDKMAKILLESLDNTKTHGNGTSDIYAHAIVAKKHSHFTMCPPIAFDLSSGLSGRKKFPTEVRIKNIKNNSKEKVFGIGFHKTGSTTLQRCCEKLGFSPAKATSPNLYKLYKKGKYSKIINTIDNFKMARDWPWLLLYKQLYAKYPDAKFALTVRKNPLIWYTSLCNHCWKNDGSKYNGPAWRKYLYGYSMPYNEKWNDEKKKEICLKHIDVYMKHNRDVVDFFKDKPKEQFKVLCWGLGDQWKELCNLLEKPIVKNDLPHALKGCGHFEKPYTDDVQKIIMEKYKKDIEYFKYEF
jgi:GR25 family glycosyltransferase involved in LPS biosynthesis